MLALYLVKRTALAAGVCAIVLIVLVALVHIAPGDPARILAEQQGQRPSPAYLATVRKELELDKPFTTQLWSFLSHAARGDLGRDFSSRVPVTHLIGQALPDTVVLAFSGIFLSIVVGVPLGVIVARRPNTVFDRTAGAVSVVLISALPYVLGLFLLILFAVKLHWLPAHGSGSLSDPIDYSRHLILPALALAIPWWGYISRLVRASMLEVVGSPYIRTARALGFRERVIFYKYALKNALVPVVALFGLMLGYSLAGTVYVELIFQRPGLGALALDAITVRNWPVVRATVLVYALFFVLGNLIADLLYRFLDPRIRIEEEAEVLA